MGKRGVQNEQTPIKCFACLFLHYVPVSAGCISVTIHCSASNSEEFILHSAGKLLKYLLESKSNQDAEALCRLWRLYRKLANLQLQDYVIVGHITNCAKKKQGQIVPCLPPLNRVQEGRFLSE